jgi:hypothetical protein
MLFVKHLREGLLEKGLIYCRGQAERKEGAKNNGFILSVALRRSDFSPVQARY